MGNLKNLIEKLKDIKMENLKKPFSLLEMLYRQVYGKELVQSEMLAGLLRPSENHGHGSDLVEHFLRHIGVKVELQKDSNIEVETEKNVNVGRIDIFISWFDGDKNHAVIIENKLHNAKNQRKQLTNYHDAIIQKGYEVDKIVYMPLSKEYQNVENTDNDKEVITKAINFEAKDIVDWLEKAIKEYPKFANSVVNQYKDFLNCLISNQYIMQQATEIQEKLSLEEIEKLEKLAEIMRSPEWCKVRFRSIVEQIPEGGFEKELLIKYKQNKNYVNYAQFYFDNWQNTFWYEVWLYPNDGIYLYKNDGNGTYTEITKFGVSKTEELVKFIVPLLQDLAKQ